MEASRKPNTALRGRPGRALSWAQAVLQSHSPHAVALGSLQPRRAQSLNGLRFRMSDLGIRLYASDVRRGLADESYHVGRGSRFRFISYSQAGCAACTLPDWLHVGVKRDRQTFRHLQ
jgi:hypothetical protein